MPDKTDFSKRWVNLASARLGARAIRCSDDFFAPMHRMLNDAPAVWKEGVYDDNGKWMDGWESRRRREPGHDWCIVKLAHPGLIHGIELDTTHFTGNFPPAASLQGCCCRADDPEENQQWTELMERCDLTGDAQRQFIPNSAQVCSHVRLHIFPDGGIARLRVFGAPQIDWRSIPENQPVDLAAALNGGVAIACNDQHYGDIRHLLAPGRGRNMGDGWETRRRRQPGNDWVLIALARPGNVKRIEIDTAHFKGNYPDRVDVQGALVQADDSSDLAAASAAWATLLLPSKLSADQLHVFDVDPGIAGVVSHIRVNIHPDGGLSRIRVYATLADAAHG